MPSDQDLIAARIDSFYETISGPAGFDHAWDALPALFVPGASILSRTAGTRPQALPVSEYINGLRTSLANRDFFERGSDYRIEIYGDLAQVLSRYEASDDPSYTRIGKRGTNLIHLAREAGNWRIAGMVYQDD